MKHFIFLPNLFIALKQIQNIYWMQKYLITTTIQRHYLYSVELKVWWVSTFYVNKLLKSRRFQAPIHAIYKLTMAMQTQLKITQTSLDRQKPLLLWWLICTMSSAFHNNYLKCTLNEHERIHQIKCTKVDQSLLSNALLMVHMSHVNKSGFCLSRDVWVIFNSVCIAIVCLYIAWICD